VNSSPLARIVIWRGYSLVLGKRSGEEEDGEAQPFIGALAEVGFLVLVMLVIEARTVGAPDAAREV